MYNYSFIKINFVLLKTILVKLSISKGIYAIIILKHNIRKKLILFQKTEIWKIRNLTSITPEDSY